MTRPENTLVGSFADEVRVPSDLARLLGAALLPTLLYGTQFFIRDSELFGMGLFFHF